MREIRRRRIQAGRLDLRPKKEREANNRRSGEGVKKSGRIGSSRDVNEAASVAS